MSDHRARFPDDYPCEVLRGSRKPNLRRARQELERRIAWIERKLAAFDKEDIAHHRGAASYLMGELAALHVVLELAERSPRTTRIDG